jgi:hypothetical protein
LEIECKRILELQTGLDGSAVVKPRPKFRDFFAERLSGKIRLITMQAIDLPLLNIFYSFSTARTQRFIPNGLHSTKPIPSSSQTANTHYFVIVINFFKFSLAHTTILQQVAPGET